MKDDLCFFLFFVNNEVIYYTYCSHTLQQNGILKKKKT